MKLKFEKNMRIIHDLMGYCHFLGANDISADLKMEPARTRFTVKAYLPKLCKTELNSITAALSVPRQREIEQNYWNISGGEELDGEIALVGAMTDSAEVSYNDGGLIIELERIHASAQA